MSNIWCNRCHKLLATPWCPECDKPDSRLERANKQIVELRAELEAARKVADAAVNEQICRHVLARLRVFEPQGSVARCEVAMAADDAEFALQVAVREYRARAEAGKEKDG